MAAWLRREDHKLSSVQRYLSIKTDDISKVVDSLEELRIEDPKTYSKVVRSPEYISFRASLEGALDYLGNDNEE